MINGWTVSGEAGICWTVEKTQALVPSPHTHTSYLAASHVTRHNELTLDLRGRERKNSRLEATHEQKQSLEKNDGRVVKTNVGFLSLVRGFF